MLTTTLRTDHPLVRITIKPDAQNGLRETSQIAIDKIMTLPATRITRKIGEAKRRCDAASNAGNGGVLGIG